MSPIDPTSLIGAAALSAARKIGEFSIGKVLDHITPLLNIGGQYRRPMGLEKAAEAYVKATAERCLKVKTLINRDKPVELLSMYVDVRFRHNNTQVDQFDVIESIYQHRRTTICGTGGTGKSMFMRYLWISQSLRSDPLRSRQQIPVFIELRQLNDLTTTELITFVFNTVFAGVSNADGLPYFIEMMNQGRFSFILDGFDEVVEDKKRTIERQIIDMSNNFGNCSFTVSTRPLDHVISWPQFKTYHVSPMTQRDVLALIERIDFSANIKRKFSNAIKKNLFNTHQSFLEIPLLATVMLFVFNDIADVPNEMNVFYDQAFWALFRRHDAAKESFERKLKSSLSIESFKSMVAAFCYFSYTSAQTNLSETQLRQHIVSASNFLEIKVDPEHFKDDMKDNICFLQMDGLDYIFIHRTFQEYFTAVFISNLPENDWIGAISKLDFSPTENVIRLLYEMNSDRFDAAVTFKIIDQLDTKSKNIENFLGSLIEIEDKSLNVFLHVRSIHNIKKMFLILSFSWYDNKTMQFLFYYASFCRTTTIIPGARSLPLDSSPQALQKLIQDSVSSSKKMPSYKRSSYIEAYLELYQINKECVWLTGRDLTSYSESFVAEIRDFVRSSESFKELLSRLAGCIKAIALAKANKEKRSSMSRSLFASTSFPSEK